MIIVIPFFGIAIFYVLCKFLVLQVITRGEYIYGSFYLTMMVMIKKGKTKNGIEGIVKSKEDNNYCCVSCGECFKTIQDLELHSKSCKK